MACNASRYRERLCVQLVGQEKIKFESAVIPEAAFVDLYYPFHLYKNKLITRKQSTYKQWRGLNASSLISTITIVASFELEQSAQW